MSTLIGSEDDRGFHVSASGIWHRDSGMKSKIAGAFVFETITQQLISLFLTL